MKISGKNIGLAAVLALVSSVASAADGTEMRFVQIEASNAVQRTILVNHGVSIEAVRTGSVWGFATRKVMDQVRAHGIPVLGDFDLAVARGGHESNFDFPTDDSRYHNYDRTISALHTMQGANADISRIVSIGKSLEGRDLWALHINTTPDALMSGKSTKPGAIYMGNHHAREHLSNEIPLMYAEYLLKNRADAQIGTLLGSRDIWIIPMVNPDGAEYDISTGNYQLWRKNRRNNGDGTYGVDLNRNYGYQWGTGGSSNDTSSDIYMGPAPFSEPETQVIRDFVKSQPNAKVLLTFHSYSELVLYPWGHTNDPISNSRDLAAFEKLATTMAGWNHYTPEPSSALYIASGDTTDWAYGELGIFAFTFELSPNANSGMGGDGFYPGAGIIDKVFQDNLKPCLYLLDAADNPYKVVASEPTGFLHNYVEPKALSTF